MLRKITYWLFGPLPFWIALGILLYGGFGRHVPHDYWNAAPWILFFSRPFCIFTFAIVWFFFWLGDVMRQQ